MIRFIPSKRMFHALFNDFRQRIIHQTVLKRVELMLNHYHSKTYMKGNLVPPSFRSSAEIVFDPWREKNLAIFGNIAMGKSQGKRSRSTYDGSIGGVLRPMAWTHEFVLSSRPWNYASQMSAHCEYNHQERGRHV